MFLCFGLIYFKKIGMMSDYKEVFMSGIERSITTIAPPKKVWRSWAQMQTWSSGTGKSAFKVGYKGQISPQRGKPIPFKIVDIDKNKSFTMIWYARFVKLVFKHSVEQNGKGSLIHCNVKFKGILGPVVRLFIGKRIKEQVDQSLSQFVYQVENY